MTAMKKILIVLFLSSCTLAGFAQITAPMPLPASIYVRSYQLQVGYNTTTMLVFPFPVKPGDKGRGDEDLVVRKQPGADNILSVKAGRKNFTPTSLHVITGDGKLYVFSVSYTDNPDCLAYDFSKLDSSAGGDLGKRSPKVLFPGVLPNDADLRSAVRSIRTARPQFSVTSRKYRMTFRLENIGQKNNLLLFRFCIRNKSGLPYPPDFLRLYIRDERRVKRSSQQETEIVPVYKSRLGVIPGESQATYIIAVKAFTIPDNKQCMAELYEANGGRNISLSISNRRLLEAKSL